MEFQALRYEQPGGVFYAIVVPASVVVNRLEIRRRRDGGLGVQRDEDLGRSRAIAAYLERDDAVIPTPILVSATSEAVRLVDGKICVDDAESAVWGHVLDGQHRILGLRLLDPSYLAKIDLLVAFAFDIDVFSEATIFATINSNQKQVSKSLIYDLFELSDKWSYERAAHEIVKSLNEDSASPFYRRIKMLGRKMESTETLSQAAFIDRLLDSIRASKTGLAAHFSDEKEWEARKIISNVFSAIVSSTAMEGHEYPQDYFFRTNGYGGVMKALNALVEAGKKSGKLTPDFFENVFRSMLQNYPVPPEGTGNAAQIAIRDRILSVL